MALQLKRPTVYFSNQMESLAESLGEELWHPKANPFVSKLIILPHHGLKSYLHRFFAGHPHFNIAMGLECKVLMEAMKHLLGSSFAFPSELALSFAVEQELQNIGTDEIFSPLIGYLKKQSSEKAFSWLIEELSKLFYEYAVFEPKLLAKWQGEGKWQQEIWKRILRRFSNWKLLPQVLEQHPKDKKEIHLFGFSHIPAHFYDFFSKFEAKWYFLSPSEMFWEDLCSDKERIYLEKKMEKGRVRLQVQEQLRFFLTKTHPLLANWGTSAKALLAFFGKTECYIEERYKQSSKIGALAFLQKSLLELDDEETKVELSVKDNSLLCMSASSPLREVEVLMQTLQELKVSPKDVLVLVSDMSIYEPYIHMVFGAKSSPFPYCIHGLASKSKLYQTIEHLEQMVKCRFDRDSVKKFMFFAPVMDKWGFAEEDILWLEKQWDRAHIFFGLTPEHKKYCLRMSAPHEVLQEDMLAGGTWQEGIVRALEGLAQEEILFSSPEWTQVELLSKAIQLLHHLGESCRPIYLEEKRSFAFWIDWAKDWFFTHLLPSQEVEDFLSYAKELEKEVGQEMFLIPFSSFMRAVRGYFQRKKQSFQSHLVEAIKCIQLEMGGAHPAKVLYILGCDGETLPGVDERSCLEESVEKKQTPSIADQNRYLFLELILHAREHLIFSYTRVSAEDQKPQPPCPMIEEIFTYIDSRCFFKESNATISSCYKRQHQTISFSKEYFKRTASYPIFSSELFSLAKSYYHSEKEPLSPFFPTWHALGGRADVEEDSITIWIRDLEEFAKYPLRAYFRQTLNMYFDSSFVEDKEFFLTPLLQKKLLSSFRETTQIQGSLPLGRWKELAEKELEKELDRRKKSLNLFGVKEEDMLCLEWVEGVRQIEQKEDRITLPALCIHLENGPAITLKGHIAHATSEGLIWFGKKKKEEYIHLWPTFLLFLCAAKELNFKSRCWLAQEEKFFPYIPSDPGKELKKYLSLYLRALKEPCPIAPPWAIPFVEGQKESWQTKIKTPSFGTFFLDPYKEWIDIRDPSPAPLHIEKKWQKQWQEVFALF